jgi:hypothetical protein
MFSFEKLSFSKNHHLTDCAYSIRILRVPNFFVAARRRKRKKIVPILSLLLFQSCRELIKVTDCNELENLAEFYIFIWGTARRLAATKTFIFWSDADSKMRKAFPILKMNQGCFTFCQKLFRSNDHFSKNIFGQMTIFRKKLFD